MPRSKVKQKKENEWMEIEDLVRQYKTIYKDPSKTMETDTLAIAIIERFYPLFRKYLIMIKNGNINFNDEDSRNFVRCFMIEPVLKECISKNDLPLTARNAIYQRFNFVKESYGALSEEEIMYDLRYLLTIMLSRYQLIGKSFCAYIKGCYYFEVFRHIKKFIKDPTNIHYKATEYEEYMIDDENGTLGVFTDDRNFETPEGIPDISWIMGKTCAPIFSSLTSFQRRILVKSYLEKVSDIKLSIGFGIPITQISRIKKDAVKQIMDAQAQFSH